MSTEETSNVIDGKVCNKCNQNLPITSFHKHRNSTLPTCKRCQNSYNTNAYKTRKHTEKGHISQMYYSQNMKSVKRAHNKPNYTKEWFSDWLYKNGYKGLYEEWKNSGFTSDMVPSVDRIDNRVGYMKDNIQLMTWAENRAKGWLEKQKPVTIMDEYGENIQSFPSIKAAAEYIGTSHTNLSRSLRRKGGKCCGFLCFYQ